MSARPLFTALWKVAAVALGGALAVASSGCTTDAFCFSDCPGAGTGTTTGTGGAGGDILSGGNGGCGLFGCGMGGDGGGVGGCEITNGGTEKCDGIDNDCNGKVDDSPDIDFENIVTCGTCDNNCAAIPEMNCMPDAIVCGPSPDPGKVPGTCTCTSCADEFYDIDQNGTCEYHCVGVANPNGETVCDGADNDCDGLTDEDVDFCTSLTACGKCNNTCVVAHGTPQCHNDGNMPCDASNTQCMIGSCDDDNADGSPDWWDLDNSYGTGCEYPCSLTNGGVEICGDGIDNDCDGLIDGADDLSGDLAVGQPCFGDPDGECHTPAHQGLTACVGNQVVCTGANLMFENDQPELCNLLDDDCDGIVDDSPTDAGGSCGQFNIFPCSKGIEQCQNGLLVCVGKVDPVPETCNGQDDDCDGVIDKTGNVPPADATGPCNVPIPPPANATSPCVAGAKACVGGTVVCQGSVGPTSAVDGCGDDSNCDGILTNQPNLQTDPQHCGTCANNCMFGAVHANWGCTNGGCVFLGCEPGYWDLNNDNKCEYACTFVSAQEACNGVDDNCNGTIDEGVVAPSPVQVCGVSPSALTPECTTGVTVACAGGTWQCTFPANVCNPTCAGATEVCDALDNDCDGIVNENTPNYGKPCASDDGLPPPGHGACKTTGTFVCTGPNSVACSAVKADCATLPGGCTELCDGVDNDCDGLVDEAFNNKGSNAANFVKPNVTRISGTRWMYSYEASRPSSTSSVPGSGNGFQCTGGATCTVSGQTVPSAPANTPLDKTPACSVPTKIPWFNVSPTEVEHVCASMGGFVCATADWQTSCTPAATCQWGYNPRTDSGDAGNTIDCAETYSASKFCNLGPSFDFSGAIPGDQDGLLVTHSASLQNCYSDWSGLQGNLAADNKIYDMTGNLREITKQAANTYKLMGGAYNTAAEGGATCGFTFYTVDQSFKFPDTGFRCCFSADPRL